MNKQIINPTDENEFTRCVSCKKSLVGGDVKKCEKKYVGDFTNYSLLKPVYENKKDKGLVIGWTCPHCGHLIKRFSE